MGNLEGISFWGQRTLDDIICYNICSFISYGMLQLGAFINIDKGKINYNGQNMSLLRPVNVPGLSNYSIYKDVTNNFVWENNISLSYTGGAQPINISGIYVNDVFYPTGSVVGSSGWSLDYSKGQVTFYSPLTSNSKVELPRTVRGVQTYLGDSSEIRQLISNWREFNNTTGVNSFQYNAYLPCVSVEILNMNTIRGTELGSRMKFVNANLEFNIIANNAYEAKKINDLLYNLEEKYVALFDLDESPRPLNSKGEIIATGLIWPNLTTQFPGGGGRFSQNYQSTKIKNGNIPLFFYRSRISFEFDASPIAI